MSKLLTNVSDVPLRAVWLVKRMWSNRILANSPVLLVALSISLACIYSMNPKNAPATNSGDTSRQQLTIKQTQPTSSAIEASETAPSGQDDNTTASTTDSTSESLTKEEISPSTVSNSSHDLSDDQPYTVAEPPDGCNTSCTSSPPPSFPRLGCNSCQPNTHETDIGYRCPYIRCPIDF